MPSTEHETPAGAADAAEEGDAAELDGFTVVPSGYGTRWILPTREHEAAACHDASAPRCKHTGVGHYALLLLLFAVACTQGPGKGALPLAPSRPCQPEPSPSRGDPPASVEPNALQRLWHDTVGVGRRVHRWCAKKTNADGA